MWFGLWAEQAITEQGHNFREQISFIIRYYVSSADNSEMFDISRELMISQNGPKKEFFRWPLRNRAKLPTSEAFARAGRICVSQVAPESSCRSRIARSSFLCCRITAIAPGYTIFKSGRETASGSLLAERGGAD